MLLKSKIYKEGNALVISWHTISSKGSGNPVVRTRRVAMHLIISCWSPFCIDDSLHASGRLSTIFWLVDIRIGSITAEMTAGSEDSRFGWLRICVLICLNSHFVKPWQHTSQCVNGAVILLEEKWPFLEILPYSWENSIVRSVQIHLRVHVSNHRN